MTTQIKEQFVFPFLLGVEPIKRLLIISFKDDPEYEMIEPQYYNDPVFGKGLRILIYRTDKKVDVYYQDGILFDRSDFAVGKGLGNAIETHIYPDRFEISETGVDVDIVFSDYKGRRIELFIKESSKSKNPLPFLAPVGNEMEKPKKLLMAYMNEFDFVKRKGTLIRAMVNDRKLLPANFAIKRVGEKVYFARYASKLTIGEINPPASIPLIAENTQNDFAVGMHNFKMNQQHEVTSYWVKYGSEIIEMKFDNGLPNLLNMQQNQVVKGIWEYAVSGTVLTGGDYMLLRSGDLVSAQLDVTRKWNPKSLPFSLMAFTFFVRSFRTWPTTYKWKGRVNLTDFSMQGNWQRK